MIDKRIITRLQMYVCILYNPKYRIKQWFNCSQYGYKAARYQNQTVCNICLERHISTTCHSSIPKYVLCQDSHSTFNKKCTHRLKEIDHIKATQFDAPCYYKIQIIPANMFTLCPKMAIQPQLLLLGQNTLAKGSSNASAQYTGPRTQPANKKNKAFR